MNKTLEGHNQLNLGQKLKCFVFIQIENRDENFDIQSDRKMDY